MATLSVVYSGIDRINRLATEAAGANWDAGTDLGEQAERLEMIVELAGRSAKLLRALNKALRG